MAENIRLKLLLVSAILSSRLAWEDGSLMLQDPCIMMVIKMLARREGELVISQRVEKYPYNEVIKKQPVLSKIFGPQVNRN